MDRQDLRALTGLRNFSSGRVITKPYLSILGKKWTFEQETFVNRHFGALLLRTLASVRKKSLVKKKNTKGISLQFQEAGALVFHYQNGDKDVCHFTSGKLTEISGNDIWRTIIRNGVLDKIDQGVHLEEIWHIHSHPGPEHLKAESKNVGIDRSMSDVDFRSYVFMQSYFTHYTGHSIRFYGFVCPVGKTCDQYFLATNPNRHFAPIEIASGYCNAKINKGKRKIMRKLPVSFPKFLG